MATPKVSNKVKVGNTLVRKARTLMNLIDNKFLADPGAGTGELKKKIHPATVARLDKMINSLCELVDDYRGSDPHPPRG